MLSASLLRPFQFRGKARLLHALCPRSGVRAATVFGYQIKLDLQNYIERSIYLHVFEPLETALVRPYLRPGMIVVDVGANIGYYSFMTSSIIGKEGHVYAFEPSPYAVNKLRDTIQRNNIDNVTVIECALGDVEGTGGIFISEKRDNYTPSMVRQNFAPTPIPVTTLDSFLERQAITRVDFLKIDVEGYEPNVIRGAHESLSVGRIKAILCEFNERWLIRNQSSSAELFDTLTSYGFAPSGCVYRDGLTLQNLLLIRSEG